MKVYRGRRGPDGCAVTVDGDLLDPRYDLRVFSASGFEWGYDGDGPSQLALAILADHFGDDARALADYRFFRDTVISTLQEDTWTIAGKAIDHTFDTTTIVNMTLDELIDKLRWKG